jgi:hypothetical protein
MSSYKKDIKTTHPVALQRDQSEYHAPDGGPWHVNGKCVACPVCGISYIVDEGFSHEFLLGKLKEDHARTRSHAPYIASNPAFTTVTDCKCK